MLLHKSKIAKFLILASALFVPVSCKDDVGADFLVPDVPFTVYMSSTEILSMGNNTAITLNDGGMMGLIVYKRSSEEFYAYERLCTNYPADTAAVVLDPQTMVATCPKCKSTFHILLGGEVTKGPASYALKEYGTTLTGGRLIISN
jgi:Ferredoxin subunits of nitrite reductase and ring-hydroxylating dioxygenases